MKYFTVSLLFGCLVLSLSISACSSGTSTPTLQASEAQTTEPTTDPTDDPTSTQPPTQLAQASTEPTEEQPNATYVPSGTVDVGGYELYYNCAGEGSPTIIIEPGFSEPGSRGTWNTVVAQGQHTTRICTY